MSSRSDRVAFVLSEGASLGAVDVGMLHALYELLERLRGLGVEGDAARLHALPSRMWPLIADERQSTPERGAEATELLASVQEAVERELSADQREVLVAITLNGVPIDVLAERFDTTRGSIYKTMHDTRQKLGVALALARLLGPAGPELSCEECFEQLDRYVELELAGYDADASISGMRAHLDGCSACAEDRDSLRALLISDAADK